jgi:hypothetical protein
VRDFLEGGGDLTAMLFKANSDGLPAEELAEVVDALDQFEATVKKWGGPFLFGDFSLADVFLAPILPVLQLSPNPAVNLSQHPSLLGAVKALEERVSYRVSATDLFTRRRLVSMFQNAQEGGSSPVWHHHSCTARSWRILALPKPTCPLRQSVKHLRGGLHYLSSTCEAACTPAACTLIGGHAGTPHWCF